MTSESASISKKRLDSSEHDSDSLEKQIPKDLHIQKRLLTPFLTKKIPPLPSSIEERKLNPQYRTKNPFARLLYWWLTPLLTAGYKRTIQPNDLYLLDEDEKVEVMYQQYIAYFNTEVAKLKLKYEQNPEKFKKKHKAKKLNNKNQSDSEEKSEEDEDEDNFVIPVKTILLCLYKTFWFQYTRGIIQKMICEAANVCSPIVQKRLINIVKARAMGTHLNVGKGVGYSMGCAAFVLCVGISVNHFLNNSMMVGAKCKAILTKHMLEKSFKLSPKGKHRYPAGKINSIMSTDINRIDLAIGFLPFLVVFPIPIVVSIALLIVNLGANALVGIAIFLLASVFIGSVIKPLMEYRKSANVFTDARVNLIKELLKNFRIIKFYSWEDFYREKIAYNRDKEMSIILNMQSMRNVITSLGVSLSTVSSMVAFCVLWKVDSGRNIGDIFSSLTLYQVLSQQFMSAPMALSMVTDMTVGLRIVCAFLSQGEVELECESAEVLTDSSLAIEVDHAEFHWKTFLLEDEKKNDDLKISKTKSTVPLDQVNPHY
ncbi:unnamed protein product [Ambrosiozyma monospora]|uniref:Unnamed protein product n=1 Tax=Ambrosiozyma monospora TaxID=43982 RepID=A0ACB5T516_AMBMO|nr:unnamed protein product [Ambrosiozyma monospora]